MESTIHWIDHYSLDDSIDCDSTHPLGRDLSAGEHQATFEQLGPVSVKVVSSTKSRRHSGCGSIFLWTFHDIWGNVCLLLCKLSGLKCLWKNIIANNV